VIHDISSSLSEARKNEPIRPLVRSFQLQMRAVSLLTLFSDYRQTTSSILARVIAGVPDKRERPGNLRNKKE